MRSVFIPEIQYKNYQSEVFSTGKSTNSNNQMERRLCKTLDVLRLFVVSEKKSFQIFCQSMPRVQVQLFKY